MKKNIVVISLFDGISIGKKALKDVNIKPLCYYSSEIDKDAIAVANYHFPEDKNYRLGDIKNINGYKLKEKILKKYGKNIKILLIGGSPCTNLSFAGKMNGLVTKDNIEITTLDQYLELKEKKFIFEGQSYLFWEYVRLREEIKPDFILLENVRMSKKWKEVFNRIIGFEPIEINSALVSAQQRKRLYWIGKKNKNGNYEKINIPLPEDKNIKLIDVLDKNEPFSNIPKCMYGYCGKRQRIFLCNWIKKEKANTITTIRSHTNQYLLNEDKTASRLLTLNEVEKLQTLPKDYTKYGINKEGDKYELTITARYRLIGNAWTLEVIKHIFEYILKEI